MDTDRRQEDTSLGGRVDLLAVAPDGVGVLIELKRGERSRPKVEKQEGGATWMGSPDQHAD
jgi:hypothetical protein